MTRMESAGAIGRTNQSPTRLTFLVEEEVRRKEKMCIMQAPAQKRDRRVSFSDQVVTSVVEVPNKRDDENLKRRLFYSREDIQTFNLLAEQQRIFQAMKRHCSSSGQQKEGCASASSE